MIEETVRYSCRSCGSTNIIRNGRNKCGSPQYHCRDCGVYRVLRPKERYTAGDKAQILRAYRERMSLRGLQRVFVVWRGTVLRWLWTAQCRRTRQIVAYAIGDRSQDTGCLMWQAVRDAYKRCPCYTDHWEAYTLFLPPDQHLPAGKATGLTAHQERWYNTLRQWLGRYTRKSLSFSKEDYYLDLVTRWFILEHNLAIRVSLTT